MYCRDDTNCFLSAYVAGRAMQPGGPGPENSCTKYGCLSLPDHRPIAAECTKFIISTTLYSVCLDRTVEDYQLLDDVQEVFHGHRSTRHQLSKFRELLEQHCKSKSQISQ